MLSLCSSASSAALLLSAGGGDTGGAPAGRIGRTLVSSVAYPSETETSTRQGI